MTDEMNQIRSYANRLFDGVLDGSELQELESLIMADQKNLQTYVEMINLHGALVLEAEGQTDEQAVISAFRNHSQVCLKEQHRIHRISRWMLSSAAVVLSCLGWLLYSNMNHPRPVGMIMHLTKDAKSHSQSLELGRTVFPGKTVDVAEGVVSLQLNQVLLDLIGPAKLTLDEMSEVHLLQGALVARVLPGGEGFTVNTPGTRIVDLGTEFSVEYSLEKGTQVSVQKGRTRINVLNHQGTLAQVLELSSHRSAVLEPQRPVIMETEYSPQRFQQVSQARGTIFSTSGQLRTNQDVLRSLTSKSVQTLNHILLIPEQQNVRLDADLTVETKSGPIRLPAGTVVSSYLIHYDPQDIGSLSPRAAVTFMSRILGVITTTDALIATDAQFGLPEVKYDHGSFRGLESNADQIHVSDDDRTVSCFFGMAPPAYLDQARILVIAD